MDTKTKFHHEAYERIAEIAKQIEYLTDQLFGEVANLIAVEEDKNAMDDVISGIRSGGYELEALLEEAHESLDWDEETYTLSLPKEENEDE